MNLDERDRERQQQLARRRNGVRGQHCAASATASFTLDSRRI
jgi:hypothetical protein